jgi:hypothetical protein
VSKLTTQSGGETTTDSCWLVWIVRGLNESTNHWSGAVGAVWTYTQSIQQIQLSESETWHNKKMVGSRTSMSEKPILGIYE